MIYVTWFNWMLQQYFMLIVLLNFLIAIISQAYENDLAMSVQNEYRQKCEMNLEAFFLLEFLGF